MKQRTINNNQPNNNQLKAEIEIVNFGFFYVNSLSEKTLTKDRLLYFLQFSDFFKFNLNTFGFKLLDF